VLLNCLLIVTVTILSLLVYEDFKKQEVGVWALVTYCSCLILMILNSEPFVMVLKDISLSFLSAIFLIAILFFYSKLRFKEKNFLKEVFGLGDVVFILVSSLLFKPFGFWLFIVISSFSAVISSLILSLKKKNHLNSIPFISYMGLVICILMTQLCPLLEINRYLGSLIFSINL